MHRKHGSTNTSPRFNGGTFPSNQSSLSRHRLCMCATRWLPPAGVTTQWALAVSRSGSNEGELWRRLVALHQRWHGSRHMRTWLSYHRLNPSEAERRTWTDRRVQNRFISRLHLFSDRDFWSSGTAALAGYLFAKIPYIISRKRHSYPFVWSPIYGLVWKLRELSPPSGTTVYYMYVITCISKGKIEKHDADKLVHFGPCPDTLLPLLALCLQPLTKTDKAFKNKKVSKCGAKWPGLLSLTLKELSLKYQRPLWHHYHNCKTESLFTDHQLYLHSLGPFQSL